MQRVAKSLEKKLARLQASPQAAEFLLADAKDADLGPGLAAPGPRRGPTGEIQGWRSIQEYRQQIREIVEQGLVDIMLVSASTAERLVGEERLFDQSSVTPAVRANDTTDIWCGGSADYCREPSLPFRSTTLEHVQSWRAECRPEERSQGVDLGLYSLTFNNRAAEDRETLTAYREFRREAELKGFRYFLEVFAPNASSLPAEKQPAFVHDCLVRSLAGVTRRGRPLFLKIPYFGPGPLEQLLNYDSELIVGIMGGSAGTTRDAFELLAESRRYGARAALFGRKINQAEHQLSFVQHLRWLADGELGAEEAVKSYHGSLAQLGIRPDRSLEVDLQRTW